LSSRAQAHIAGEMAAPAMAERLGVPLAESVPHGCVGGDPVADVWERALQGGLRPHRKSA
jgi:hypothetical protein